MKKTFQLLFSSLLLFNFSFAQEIEWQKCFGGSVSESSMRITNTYDGGLISIGHSLSNDGDLNFNHGMVDYWVVKTDNNGNIEWQKTFGGSANDYGIGVTQASDSNYLFVGMSQSNDGDLTNNYGDYDIWIVRCDQSGNIIWEKSFGGTLGDRADCIRQTSDNNFIVAGLSRSNNYDVSGNHGLNDFWVFKMDSAGNILWQKCYGGSSHDDAFSINLTNDNGFIVCGQTESNDGDVMGLIGFINYWVIKLDSIGNLEWQKCLGGNYIDYGYYAVQLSDGNYLAAGTAKSTIPCNHGFGDIWVVKLDSAGNIISQNCYGGSYEEHFGGLSVTPDGNVLIAGSTSSTDGDLPLGKGLTDAWLFEIDSTGNFINNKRFGGVYYDAFQSMCFSYSDSSIFLLGSTSSDNGDVSGNHGTSDYWLVKFTYDYNSISGKLFIDTNSNAIHDAGEPPLNYNQVYELNTGKFSFSQSNGGYNLNVLDTGNFTVVSSLNYYNAVPATHTAYFSGINQTDSLNDFAFQPAGVFNDLCISITPLGNFRAGFNASYMINYENVGTTTLSPTVIFFPDNDVTFVSANPVASFVTVDSVIWNFGPLAPFQTGNILVTVNVNVGTPIGTLINSNARIEPVAGDNYPGCNYAYWEVLTTGSYDPNEILVDEDTVFTTQISNPPYLEYIIYFQNTGNDTAFNARVLNNLPQELDVTTFEFVASSHPMNITYGAHARLLTFTFDNILLPDSNVNEPASHGFVRYRIKPNTTLVAGDSIENTAFIYFDFNQPVQTNTVVTEIVLPTGSPTLTLPSADGEGIALAPNPATNELIIFLKPPLRGGLVGLEIFDLFGREVFQSPIKNQQSAIKIDVSGLANGIYIVQLSTTENIYRAKLMKE